MLRTMILISITDFFKKKQTNENETRDSTREVCNNEIESIGYHRLINTIIPPDNDHYYRIV